MSNNIINQNADEQGVAQAPAATTKSPVDDNMEEQPNNDFKPSVKAVTQKEETKQPVTDLIRVVLKESPFLISGRHRNLFPTENLSKLKFKFTMP